MSNGSLDFLDMIKASGNSKDRTGRTSGPRDRASEASKSIGSDYHTESGFEGTISDVGNKSAGKNVEHEFGYEEKVVCTSKNNAGTMNIAVIDTETNWNNEVMSIGIAIASSDDFKCIDKAYYIITPEYKVGGFFSSALHVRDVYEKLCTRANAISEVQAFLDSYGVTKILAYNAKFDFSHLEDLSGYEWLDIMRLAAYKQYNTAIPDDLPCCKTGRLKTNYGVEPIMCLLTGNRRYMETHNAVLDAVDELKIVELLGRTIEEYECGRI